MTRRLQHKPLCNACRLDLGWVYEDDGSFHRCDHGATQALVAAVEKDGALEAVALANPNALEAALRIIFDTATARSVFSANDCRNAMTIARVPGQVIGTAFGQAARNGWICRDGYVTSTDPGTHGHEVKQWRSLVHRAGRAVS